MSVVHRASIRARVIAVLLAPALGGCASTSATPAFREVAQTVEQRSGQRPRWSGDSAADKEAQAAIDRILGAELTVDGAVQVALLENPSLQATFEDLALGQAELVEAGLLKNPTIGIGSTAWESEHIDPNLFVSVEYAFLDLLTLPLRKKVAATQLEATKLRVGNQVLSLAAEVRSAFYEAQAAAQVVAMRELVKGAAEAAAELAKRQYEAGTMNDLALSAEVGLASQVRLDLERSRRAAVVAREHLTKLMGLWGARAGWRMGASLPNLPPQEVALERLESLAIEKRLDVGAARREVEALDAMLSVAHTTRWTGFLNIEVEAARLRGDNRISFGPRASIELPIFNQGQAAIARLEALKRSSESTLRALSIDARSDVRATRARVLTSRKIVEEYAAVLVPARENIVKFSQQQYDAMLVGVYQLLEAKRTEFATYQEYIETLRDYWIARSDLERIVGTRLVAATGDAKPTMSGAAMAAPPPSKSPSVAPAHSGHVH